MWDSLWTAFALVLVIEGFLPFLSPQIWKRAVAQVAQLQDGQIRFFCVVGLGCGRSDALFLTAVTLCEQEILWGVSSRPGRIAVLTASPFLHVCLGPSGSHCRCLAV